MEKLFDAILLDLMDILLAGCFGCFVMEWLSEDNPDWLEEYSYRGADMKFMLN